MKLRVTNFSLAWMAALLSLSATAQVTETQISVEPPKIVNFTQIAAQEIASPPEKVIHFIQQGEDLEENYKFIGQRVPSDAINFTAPAQLSSRATVTSPAPTLTANGVLDNGTLIPPDIDGAVGTNYVMETTNQQFDIFNKSGTLVSTVSITGLFSATGGSGFFDPHIQYDAVNSRFVICIDGNASNGHGGLFVAVSQTADPTGSWYVYGFDATGNTTDFMDYPLLGFNTNWVVVTGNDFINGTSPAGRVFVMNRASLYGGTLGTVTTFDDNTAFSICPAQTFDATQTTEYLVEDYNGNSGGNGYIRISTITGTAAAPVYSTGSTLGVNQPWSETAVNAKQEGSTHALEVGDTRFSNAVYINGSLWMSHTVFLPASKPTYSGIEWWEINPSSLTLQQYERISDPNKVIFYYYSSIGVNSSGSALLGFSESSPSIYASQAYMYHASTDAASTMEGLYTYKSGVAGYYKTYGGGRNRWGDFSGTAVDPTDNSFWTFNEWANTSNNWGTALAHVPVTAGVACNSPAGMSTTHITNSTATFNWTAATGAASYNLQYRIVGTSTWSTGSTTADSFNVSGLSVGSNYEWQVETVCSSGSSPYTASTDFTTTGTACNVPTGLAAGTITNTGAALSWAAVNGVSSYILQWKTTSASTWTVVAGIATNSYPLGSLTACTAYQFEVQSACSGDSSAFSSATSFTTTGCALSYCTSTASSQSFEYIKNVTLGSINNTTAAAGYGNYTNLSTNLAAGTSNTISLTPGFTSSSYSEYFTVYIDYNHNGVFTDAGETVVEVNGTKAVSKAFTVPTTAINGSTRMRIQMQYGAYETNSCATFTYGGVQDYTVNITGGAAEPEVSGSVVAEGGAIMQDIKIYPNPTQANLNVDFNSGMDGKLQLNVYNMSGQRVISNENAYGPGFNTQSVNLASLSEGVYVLEIQSEGIIQRQKFIIAK